VSDGSPRPPAAGAAPSVTVVVAARNAAAIIEDCLTSVRWAGEVLVVENDSTDDTVARARATGATVLNHPFRTIGLQRNAAIERARGDWILVLDADERCTPALAAEIARLIGGSPDRDAWRIGRRNFFMGKEIRHGGWEGSRDRPIRLFRRALRYDDSPVHEHVIAPAGVGALREPLLHTPYASLDEYFEKLNRYSRSWARQHYDRGRRAGALTLLVKPPARFVSMWLIRGGFLDGAPGLVLAVMAAVSVAAKYARLWELTRRGAGAP
jgi:glycosyltransferase involved in cell wall biosynthesis